MTSFSDARRVRLFLSIRVFVAPGLNELVLQDRFMGDQELPRIGWRGPRPIREGFEFRGVSFRYPDSDRQVLKNINLRIEPGERIALVGENGQGKTTLVKLLARLYDPTEGAIFLDGIDLREYSIEDLSKEIGIIFQDFVRYEISARENIGVGRIEEISNELRVSEAARKSLADAVVAKLPNGLTPNAGASI